MKMEPVEDLVIDVPEEFQGVVIAQAGLGAARWSVPRAP